MSVLFSFLLLAAGLAANLVWTIYLLRKNKPRRVGDAPRISDLDAEVFLSEIHRVTSANVELLEGRIDALREVGVLADERLKRIRAALTDLEILLNRLQRLKAPSLDRHSQDGLDEEARDARVAVPIETAQESPLPPPPLPGSARRAETVWEFHRRGLTERQIAQKMGLGLAEIRFLLKLSNAGGKSPVESR